MPLKKLIVYISCQIIGKVLYVEGMMDIEGNKLRDKITFS